MEFIPAANKREKSLFYSHPNRPSQSGAVWAARSSQLAADAQLAQLGWQLAGRPCALRTPPGSPPRRPSKQRGMCDCDCDTDTGQCWKYRAALYMASMGRAIKYVLAQYTVQNKIDPDGQIEPEPAASEVLLRSRLAPLSVLCSLHSLAVLGCAPLAHTRLVHTPLPNSHRLVRCRCDTGRARSSGILYAFRVIIGTATDWHWHWHVLHVSATGCTVCLLRSVYCAASAHLSLSPPCVAPHRPPCHRLRLRPRPRCRSWMGSAHSPI